MKTLKLIVAACVLTGSLSTFGAAQMSSRSILHRDQAFEEHLRIAANPDTTITPAKVLRWLKSMMGKQENRAPSSLEFQPVVRSNDSQQQVILQFAYKF
jgi:hypothetical protein